jgi:NADP-dependent 3-hydroxy acid dehydrogenase YdfG
LTLELDVQDKEVVNEAIDSLAIDWQEIDILINNRA